MSLRSLEEQSRDLHRRERVEDREQAERESGERVLYEWTEDGTAYLLMGIDGRAMTCQQRMTIGEWARVDSSIPLMREILRLRGQARAARVEPLNRLRSRLIDVYNGHPPLSVMGILGQVQREVEDAE